MSTEVSNQLDRIEQAKNDLAGVFRERFPTIPSNAKLGDLVPYAESIANPKLQETTIYPSTGGDRIAYPDTADGYVGFSKVTVKAITAQERTVTPTKGTQEITPTNGFTVMKKVTVNPIPDKYIDTSDATATAADILKDKTAYINGEKVTGTHKCDTSGSRPETCTVKIDFGYYMSVIGNKDILIAFTESGVLNDSCRENVIRHSAGNSITIAGVHLNSPLVICFPFIGWAAQTAPNFQSGNTCIYYPSLLTGDTKNIYFYLDD